MQVLENSLHTPCSDAKAAGSAMDIESYQVVCEDIRTSTTVASNFMRNCFQVQTCQPLGLFHEDSYGPNAKTPEELGYDTPLL